MTILPLQAFGIGDIIFCQTLVRKIADSYGKDTKIVWGTLPHFVEGLNRAYPRVKFVDWRTLGISYDNRNDYEFMHAELGTCRVLPLRWADTIMKVPYTDCMKAKYAMYGMDFEIWREGAMWERDNSSENLLHHVKTLPALCNPYSFGNNIFGSDGNLTVDIPKCVVNMEMLPMHSLFDWGLIIQDASEIHTVNTSIIYLLEMLDLRAKEVHLYQRPIAGQTFETIDYILKRHKYVLHR